MQIRFVPLPLPRPSLNVVGREMEKEIHVKIEKSESPSEADDEHMATVCVDVHASGSAARNKPVKGKIVVYIST